MCQQNPSRPAPALLSSEQVIMLSYHNVKKAMDYYVSKGGTAKFIICDDGFQVRRLVGKIIAKSNGSANTAQTRCCLPAGQRLPRHAL